MRIQYQLPICAPALRMNDTQHDSKIVGLFRWNWRWLCIGLCVTARQNCLALMDLLHFHSFHKSLCHRKLFVFLIVYNSWTINGLTITKIKHFDSDSEKWESFSFCNGKIRTLHCVGQFFSLENWFCKFFYYSLTPYTDTIHSSRLSIISIHEIIKIPSILDWWYEGKFHNYFGKENFYEVNSIFEFYFIFFFSSFLCLSITKTMYFRFMFVWKWFFALQWVKILLSVLLFGSEYFGWLFIDFLCAMKFLFSFFFSHLFVFDFQLTIQFLLLFFWSFVPFLSFALRNDVLCPYWLTRSRLRWDFCKMIPIFVFLCSN